MHWNSIGALLYANSKKNRTENEEKRGKQTCR